jgi:cobalamin biosynthesis protein CbiD
LLSISRSGLYYEPKGEPAINHVVMREIDQGG